MDEESFKRAIHEYTSKEEQLVKKIKRWGEWFKTYGVGNKVSSSLSYIKIDPNKGFKDRYRLTCFYV